MKFPRWCSLLLRLLSSHLSHIYSKLTNGPIAAARGALYADVRAYRSHIKKNVKRTCSCCPLFRDYFFSISNQEWVTWPALLHSAW